ERHRADQESRTVPGALVLLVREQRERLNRLTKAHRVRKDRAQADLAEERQPGQASFLIRPQLAIERHRRAHWLQPLFRLAREQVTEPAVRVDLGYGQVRRLAESGQYRLAGGHYS